MVLFEDVVELVLSILKEGEVELQVVAVIQGLPLQFAGAQRPQELRTVDRYRFLLLIALRLVAGTFLYQHLLHALQSLLENGLGPGEDHERVFIPEQDCIAVEF